MTTHDNTDEPTVRRASFPMAIMQGSTPLFHVCGSWPPQWKINTELEMLWRAKQKPQEIRQLSFLDNVVLSHQEAENA